MQSGNAPNTGRQPLARHSPQEDAAEGSVCRTRLVGAVVAATILACLVNVGWLAAVDNGGRVRDTGYYFLSAIFFELGVNPFATLPAAVSHYRDLNNFSEITEMLPAAVLANLPVNLLLAALLLGVLALPRGSNWRRAAPAVAGIVCLAPALFLPLDSWIAAASEWWTADQLDVQQRLSRAVRVGRIGSTLGVALFVLGLSALAVTRGRTGSWVRGALGGLAAAARFVAAALVVAVGAGWMLRPAAPLPPLEASPNILLISIDTLRPDHLGGYGYHRQTSPRLDQLAREGVRFETAVAPTSWTLPSHMSLMTALDPLMTSVYDDAHRLPLGAQTLAMRLSALGYATAGIVSAGYLNGKWGFARGFDHYDDFSVGNRHFGADNRQVTTEHIIELATRWLDDWQKNEKGKPFFLFLHLYDVHYDFNPPAPYDTMFDPDYEGTITGLDFHTNPRLKPGMPKADLDHVLALYDGEIRHVDDNLGRLLDNLAERGAYDETIIAVTSDHGEEFGEHGGFGHRATLYDEVVLVPLLMRYPATIPSGAVVKEQVRLMDVAPTLLELVGADPEGLGAEGVDPTYRARTLAPLWSGVESAPADELLAFGDLLGGRVRSLRTSGAKYIVSGSGEEEFYDLKLDPAEQIQVSEGGSANEALSGLVGSWVSFSESQGAESEAGRASPQQIETLKSLGYIN